MVVAFFATIYGCSGGGGASSGSAAPPPGPTTANVELRVDANNLRWADIMAQTGSGGPPVSVVAEVVDGATADPATLSGRRLIARGEAPVEESSSSSQQSSGSSGSTSPSGSPSPSSSMEARIIILDVLPGNWQIFVFARDAQGNVVRQINFPAAIVAGQVFFQRVFLSGGGTTGGTTGGQIATGLRFAVQPSDVPVGSIISPNVVVEVVDSSNNLVTTATNAITVALGNNPGTATLGGTLTVNAVNGQATFNTLTLDRIANGYTLVASASGLNPATSNAFNVLNISGRLVPLAGFPVGKQGAGEERIGIFNNHLIVPHFGPTGFADSTTAAVFGINPATGAIAPVAGSPFGGLGNDPISVAVHTSGNFIYFVLVNSNQVAGFTYNSGTGAIGAPVPFGPQATQANPVGAAMHPTGSFLFVANFTTQSISRYQINPLTGQITLLGNTPAASAVGGPVDLRVHPSGNHLYASNGTAFDIDGLGNLTPIVGSPFAVGNGGSNLDIAPAGNFLYVPDDIAGQIRAFSINPVNGALAPVAGSPFPATVGTSTPYQVAVHPSGNFLYATSRFTNDVLMYALTNGAVSILPGGTVPAGTGPFSISAHPNGNFVYVDNGLLPGASNDISGYSVVP